MYGSWTKLQILLIPVSLLKVKLFLPKLLPGKATETYVEVKKLLLMHWNNIFALINQVPGGNIYESYKKLGVLLLQFFNGNGFVCLKKPKETDWSRCRAHESSSGNTGLKYSRSGSSMA